VNEELSFKVETIDENTGNICFEWEKVTFEFQIKNK